MGPAGWIKAHRAMLEHPCLQRADAMGVWVRLLMMAAHEPTRVTFRGKAVELSRGQVAISVLSLADELGVSHKRMRLILGKLSGDGSLKMDQATGKAYTLATICNYTAYQSPAEPAGQSEGQGEGKRRANEGQTEQEPEESKTLPIIPLRADEAPPAPPEVATKPKRRQAPARHLTSLPADLALTADMRAYAERKCPGVDADSEFERFCDHHRSRESKFKDWSAAWRTWASSPFAKTMRPQQRPKVSQGYGFGLL